MATTYTYPFDPTGSATTNAVANERHVLSPPAWTDYYFIVPKFAPYFRDSLRVIHRPSGKLLVEGKDYHCTHYFHAASHGVARRVYGSITMLDKTLTGILEISYQTIGGDWVLDASADLTRLTNTQTNPRITTWEEVVDVPYQFPPIDHQWNLEDLKGVEAILPILEEMTEAIRQSAGSDFALHIADKANPHSVTKDQVGLDQVQNLPLANIAEAQAGALNTRYMTPVRTKNLIDFYLVPIIDAHKADLNNPHGTTKTQVGLGAVQNFGLATQAEAEAGAVANKYMTPLQTRQAIEKLANSGVATHVADTNNPHGTTKAQVGLGSVENLPLASIAEAEAASRNDRYMTPLMVAKQIQVLVKDSVDLHINATNNPHLVTKAQVGLSNIANYLISTEAEAQAGLVNTSYMTPLMTRKAIEAIATGSFTQHVNNDQNPHATTKTQVGLGSVENFPLANVTEAKLGESNQRYMTPLLVAAAIEDRVGAGGGIEAHISDVSNPHKTTAAQVGAYDTATVDQKLGDKLNKTDAASNSNKLENQTLDQVLASAKAQTAADSNKLGGKTAAELFASINANNALHLEGRTFDQLNAEISAQYHFADHYQVPNLYGTDELTYTKLFSFTPDELTDLDDIVLLVSGGEPDGGGSPLQVLRIDHSDSVAETTVLSGPTPVNTLVYREDDAVTGKSSVWLKADNGHKPLAFSILSNNSYLEVDQTFPVLVAPTTPGTGLVVIPKKARVDFDQFYEQSSQSAELVTLLTTTYSSLLLK